MGLLNLVRDNISTRPHSFGDVSHPSKRRAGRLNYRHYAALGSACLFIAGLLTTPAFYHVDTSGDKPLPPAPPQRITAPNIEILSGPASAALPADHVAKEACLSWRHEKGYSWKTFQARYPRLAPSIRAAYLNYIRQCKEAGRPATEDDPENPNNTGAIINLVGALEQQRCDDNERRYQAQDEATHQQILNTLWSAPDNQESNALSQEEGICNAQDTNNSLRPEVKAFLPNITPEFARKIAFYETISPNKVRFLLEAGENPDRAVNYVQVNWEKRKADDGSVYERISLEKQPGTRTPDQWKNHFELALQLVKARGLTTFSARNVPSSLQDVFMAMAADKGITIIAFRQDEPAKEHMANNNSIPPARAKTGHYIPA